VTAQKEPSDLQKDLLARRLVGSDSTLQEAEEPCAKIQLCKTATPRLLEPDRPELLPEPELCTTARSVPYLSCETVPTLAKN
jgi:hypothetical protein